MTIVSRFPFHVLSGVLPVVKVVPLDPESEKRSGVFQQNKGEGLQYAGSR